MVRLEPPEGGGSDVCGRGGEQHSIAAAFATARHHSAEPFEEKKVVTTQEGRDEATEFFAMSASDAVTGTRPDRLRGVWPQEARLRDTGLASSRLGLRLRGCEPWPHVQGAWWRTSHHLRREVAASLRRGSNPELRGVCWRRLFHFFISLLAWLMLVLFFRHLFRRAFT